MPVGLRIPNTNFTKNRGTLVPIPFAASALGFYVYSDGGTANKVPRASQPSLTTIGSPSSTASGRVLSYGNGFDTNILETDAFTWVVILKASTGITLHMNTFVNAASFLGTSIGENPQGVFRAYLGATGGGVDSAGTTPSYPAVTVGDYYLLALTRSGLASGNTAAMYVTPKTGVQASVTRNNLAFGNSNRTVKLGTWSGGASSWTGAREHFAAGIWNRALSAAELAEVYAHFKETYPVLNFS